MVVKVHVVRRSGIVINIIYICINRFIISSYSSDQRHTCYVVFLSTIEPYVISQTDPGWGGAPPPHPNGRGPMIILSVIFIKIWSKHAKNDFTSFYFNLLHFELPPPVDIVHAPRSNPGSATVYNDIR